MLILIGLVLCLAALAAPDPQPASSARMPLSPPLAAFPIIGPLAASGGTNQAATQIPAVPLPQLEPLRAEADPAVGSGPRIKLVPMAAAVETRRCPLVWDAEMKEFHAQGGETNAYFAFSVTNTGPTSVSITEARTSCGCVTATLPEYPWRLAAGTNGLVHVMADLRGKRGLLHKLVYVYTADYGIQTLAIKVNIPDTLFEQPRRQAAKPNSAEF